MSFILLIGMVASAQGSVEKADVVCPKFIESKQELVTPVAGWSAEHHHRGSGQRHYNIGIGISRRYSTRMSAMVPETFFDGDDRSSHVNSWQLQHSAEYWVYCTYANTKVQLSQALPSGLTNCSVAYRRSRHGVLHCK